MRSRRRKNVGGESHGPGVTVEGKRSNRDGKENDMKKRKAAALLCILACLGMFTASCGAAPVEDGTEEDIGPLVAEEDAQTIFSEFETEIRYIEEKHFVMIRELNRYTLELLKAETVENLNDHRYRFAEMMDAISIAMLKQQNAKKAASTYALYSVENETYTTVVSYQALKGKYIVDAPVGSTYVYSDSVNVSIATGELIAGIKMTAQYTKSVSYSVTGPTDGTTLENGMIATHRTAIAVLLGSISRYEYDIVGIGGTTHKTEYVITPGTETIRPYTFLTNIGIPTYANRPNASGWVVAYENPTVFTNKVESEPYTLIF